MHTFMGQQGRPVCRGACNKDDRLCDERRDVRQMPTDATAFLFTLHFADLTARGRAVSIFCRSPGAGATPPRFLSAFPLEPGRPRPASSPLLSRPGVGPSPSLDARQTHFSSSVAACHRQALRQSAPSRRCHSSSPHSFAAFASFCLITFSSRDSSFSSSRAGRRRRNGETRLRGRPGW